jgi:predicted NBD/HSP70 family sugar kinase
LCDLSGAPVSDRTVELAVDREPDETLACATDLVAEAIGGMPRDHILGLGVGIASPINPRTGMLRGEAIMPGWVGLRIDDELGRRTGLTVRSTNDANAGVLGERRYGAARDCADVIYIRLSSGIGAGVVCDGRMLLGSAGLAGEIGHLPVVEAGAICRCGNRGCLETVASPTAIADLLAPSLGRNVTSMSWSSWRTRVIGRQPRGSGRRRCGGPRTRRHGDAAQPAAGRRGRRARGRRRSAVQADAPRHRALRDEPTRGEPADRGRRSR